MSQHPIKYKAIGLMSGTSLDGVDIVACNLELLNGDWSYSIIHSETLDYPLEMLSALKEAQTLSSINLSLLHVDYGKFLGIIIRDFCATYNFQPDFIASHGYTVFHQPEKSLTLQIGSGAHIAAETGVKTVCDFRTSDVALGGQGAPLVPIGDAFLFGKYSACLNLGGFSNISYQQQDKRIAFDVCPLNFILNDLSNKLGKSYDEGGNFGRQGQIDHELLEKLNGLDYYNQSPPKSLGREFVESQVYPLIIEQHDVLTLFATFYEHMAQQLANTLNAVKAQNVLVTGGGSYNTFLIDKLRSRTNTEVVIPEPKLIDMKEALVFALLGAMRLQGIPNCLASVTGARNDNVGGVVYS